jgi:hypothetical protein
MHRYASRRNDDAVYAPQGSTLRRRQRVFTQTTE